MFKVKVLTIGKSKEAWLLEAIAEYEKRLTGTLQIEWLLAKNDAQLIEWSRELSPLIALDPHGELLTSEQFSMKVLRLGSRFNFLIGGSEGIPPQIATPLKWSLSPLTFTHQMTRLILIEQLYRALEIDKKSNYHK